MFITRQEDIRSLNENIKLYEKASTAKVNWEKSEGYIMGQWDEVGYPKLPGGFRWGREGLKLLGVFVGSAQYQMKN